MIRKTIQVSYHAFPSITTPIRGKALNEARVWQIVWQFPENGLKQVLTTGGNVRDLLTPARVGGSAGQR
jgi:hypothetical protein